MKMKLAMRLIASAATNAPAADIVGARKNEFALGLTLGRRDQKTIQLVAHLDLTRQPRIRPHVETEVQHVLFHRRRRTDLLAPGLVDIDMAGGASAGAATLGLDARDRITDRPFHDGGAVLDFDGAGFAGMVDIMDLGHGRSCWRIEELGIRSGQSYNGSIRSALVSRTGVALKPMSDQEHWQERTDGP